jgi:hypothetical protein
MYAVVFRCASVSRVLIGGLHGHKCGIVVDQGDEHVREQGGAVAYVEVGSERSGGLAHRCASQRLPPAQLARYLPESRARERSWPGIR